MKFMKIKKLKNSNNLILKSYAISFVLFCIYSYTFFRSVLVAILISSVISVKFYKIFNNIFIKRDLRKEKIMLRDYLDVLNSSIISGNNFYQAVKKSSVELLELYSEEDLIVRSSKQVYLDLENGLSSAEALDKFQENFQCEEAKIFVDTLCIGLETGISLKEIISNSRNSINEYIITELEISTSLDGGRRELIIMMILPLVILMLLGQTDLTHLKIIDYIVRGVVYMIILFSFYLGEKIVNMEI